MKAWAPVALRPLAALTALVLAAHLLMLQEASLSLLPDKAPVVRVAAINTRTLTPAPTTPRCCQHTAGAPRREEAATRRKQAAPPRYGNSQPDARSGHRIKPGGTDTRAERIHNRSNGKFHEH